MPLPAFLAAALPAAVPAVINTIGNLIGARQQKKHNLELAKYQADYNSPANQMQRFRDAGLNANLIYGQGQPGNMEKIEPANIQGAFSNLGTQYQQARLLSAQANLTNQKVDESGIKQDLMKSQKSLIDNNPYMDKGYVDALITNMKGIAAIKEQQASWMTQTQTGMTMANGYAMMEQQMNNLFQKYRLNELTGKNLDADNKIKAEVLKSKGFEADLKKIQAEWMKSGDITPQHIYQGIMMLLTKMM